jgi:hypothetical protein
MRLVLLESPYAGDIERNTRYARAALADCLRRGEAPYASHLLYTQPGVLDDSNPEERRRGMEAGWEYLRAVDVVAVYCDLGITPGMRAGIERALKADKPPHYRKLFGEWSTPPTSGCDSGFCEA